jgi:UDP-4-amino-4,6-dideoxy-N-acetyl-beta-L-altrosamine transaminase
VRVLSSDFITQGPKIKEFEQALCKYTGARYAVVVSSATAALHISCIAAGISDKDEVITSPITFVASANCILYCGARPVFADTNPHTANIEPANIEKSITERTKAIIPVHFAGQPCDLEAINNIARRHGLIAIEDAAHALGAEYKGNKIGSCRYSDMAVFSFHPVKSITTGEGGAILTNNPKFYKKLLALREHGIKKEVLKKKSIGAWYYEMQFLGFNYRLTDIQAALGISQLGKLGSFIAKRREIAKTYDRNFKDNPYFDIPVGRKDVSSAHHLYPIRLKDRYKRRKKRIFSEMRKQSLGVQVHYIPVYLQPYYRNLEFRTGLCPLAEDFYEREISIPLYPSLKPAEVNYVIRTILGIFKRMK